MKGQTKQKNENNWKGIELFWTLKGGFRNEEAFVDEEFVYIWAGRNMARNLVNSGPHKR